MDRSDKDGFDRRVCDRRWVVLKRTILVGVLGSSGLVGQGFTGNVRARPHSRLSGDSDALASAYLGAFSPWSVLRNRCVKLTERARSTSGVRFGVVWLNVRRRRRMEQRACTQYGGW